LNLSYPVKFIEGKFYGPNALCIKSFTVAAFPAILFSSFYHLGASCYCYGFSIEPYYNRGPRWLFNIYLKLHARYRQYILDRKIGKDHIKGKENVSNLKRIGVFLIAIGIIASVSGIILGPFLMAKQSPGSNEIFHPVAAAYGLIAGAILFGLGSLVIIVAIYLEKNNSKAH
jgi:hypothetical protein